MTDEVIYEEVDEIAIIAINRPEKKNTLTESVVSGIADGIDAASRSKDVAAVVLRGVGDTLTAGYDLTDGSEWDVPYGAPEVEAREGVWDPVKDLALMGNNVKRFMRIWECPKPVLGELRGWAVGGAGQIRSECHVWLAALNHGSAAFVGDLARSGDRMLPPSWRLMAVALGGRGDYGVVWAWPRAPRGRGVGGEAMDAVGRVRSAGRWSRGGVGGHFQEVEDTARVPGKTAHGLGDSEPARFDDADGEATQPGHVLRAVS